MNERHVSTGLVPTSKTDHAFDSAKDWPPSPLVAAIFADFGARPRAVPPESSFTPLFSMWLAYCESIFMVTIETYTPRFVRGTRVLFLQKDHPKNGQHCTVFEPVRNPSQQSMNQWYDVRFEIDVSLGVTKDICAQRNKPKTLAKDEKRALSR